LEGIAIGNSKSGERAAESCTAYPAAVGGGTGWDMKKLGRLLVVIGLVSCGGQEVGTADSGSSGSGGGSGSGGSAGGGGGGGTGGNSGSGGSSGVLNDSGSPEPEAGSSQCDDAGTCILCADDKWHCPSSKVYTPDCAPSVTSGGSCSGMLNKDCFTCTSDGNLTQLVCHVVFTNPDKMGQLMWEPATILPTPRCSP
jgi:hypothetical protein